MAARALDLTGDIRCLAAGLVALVVGVLTFLVVAVLSLVTAAVSGAWLVLPALVMLAGVASLTAWLVFGEGAQRFDPAPSVAAPWQWGTGER